jgi:hypothetical protein
MSDILAIYEKSQFNSLPDKKADKTPIDADGGLDLSTNEAALKKARGGELNDNKYSDREFK